jgi:hypothetical protein
MLLVPPKSFMQGLLTRISVAPGATATNLAGRQALKAKSHPFLPLHMQTMLLLLLLLLPLPLLLPQGALWDWYRQLYREGWNLDANTYSTAFRCGAAHSRKKLNQVDPGTPGAVMLCAAMSLDTFCHQLRGWGVYICCTCLHAPSSMDTCRYIH